MSQGVATEMGSEDLYFSTVRVEDDWAGLEDEIETLFSSLENPNPYFSPEWLRCWLKWSNRKQKPFAAIVRDENGQLMAFWPFVEKKGIIGAKGLWPYLNNEANYFDPLGFSEAIPTLVKGVHGLLGDYHFIWTSLLRDAFWSNYLSPVLAESKTPCLLRIARKTCLADLGSFSSFDGFLSDRLGAKSQKSLRYSERRLLNLGGVTFERHTDPEGIRSMLPASCMVELNSWKGPVIAGLYSVRGKRAFFFELLPALAEKGRAVASCLRVEGFAIAWELGLLWQNGGTYGLHNLAYDEDWKLHSPGKQLLVHNLAASHTAGRSVDFLPGHLDYKQKFATRHEPVRELHWFRRSARGLLARKLILLNMKIRRRLTAKAKGRAYAAFQQNLDEYLGAFPVDSQR
jgi:hypothetical protein